jgi:hypothetical protein
MSKFHVGDKVRIHIPGNHKFHNKTGHVLTEPSFSNSLTYIVDVDITTPEDEDTDYEFTENELRPADIFAWVKEGDTVQPYVIGEAVDLVNHPPHYKKYPVEVIEITEQLDFNRGNAVKYILRAGHKAGVDELQDLSKAAWYINRAIEKLKKECESE